jgi:hypothetical protein
MLGPGVLSSLSCAVQLQEVVTGIRTEPVVVNNTVDSTAGWSLRQVHASFQLDLA